jgi:hypothetical protein
MIIRSTLRVQKRHIQRAIEFAKTGQIGVARNCVLSQALKEMFPEADTVINYGYAEVKKGDKEIARIKYLSDKLAALSISDKEDWVNVKPTMGQIEITLL